METKEKFNLMLPVPLMEEFKRVAQPYGPKRKWLAVAAAMALFVQSPAELQEAYVQEIGSADLGVGFAELVRRAKSGDLHRAALERISGGRTRSGGKIAHVSLSDSHRSSKGRRR